MSETMAAGRSAGAPWLTAQLGGFGGAITIATMTKDWITWSVYFQQIFTVWKNAVHPITQFLFGWIFEFLRIGPMPESIKSYLAVGLIFFTASIRFAIYAATTRDEALHSYVDAQGRYAAQHPAIAVLISIYSLVATIFLWPLALAELLLGRSMIRLGRPMSAQGKNASRYALLFVASNFVWFLVLLGINFQVWEVLIPLVQRALSS
jgi:hypothetical protein